MTGPARGAQDARRNADEFAEQINKQLSGRRARASGAMAVTPDIWVGPGGRATVYTAHTKSPFDVRFDLSGTWELHLRWRWMPLLRAGGSQLIDATISLNVQLPHALADGHPLAGLGAPADAPFCLVRYDYEGHGHRRGLHLNVWQGQPLRDQAHWLLPLPGVRQSSPWSAQHVVDYLISSGVEADLANSGWPRS